MTCFGTICNYNYFGEIKMRMNIFLISIFLICGFLLISEKPQSNMPNYAENIEESKKDFIESLNINIPKSLKINFKNGVDYCKTQNIAQSGAFENCVLYYIYERSKSDHAIILKINTYCDTTTSNECDRRNCVEEFLLSD